MNAAGEEERLPHSIAGLLAFALGAWAANAALYAALAAGVFAASTLAEYALPAVKASTPAGEFKAWVLLLTGIFADSLAVAAVALGVAARAAGTAVPSRALAGAAVERWLPVIAVTFLAQFVILATSQLSALGPPPEPRALVYVTAPFVWMLWGILALAGPFVALGRNRGAFSVIVGFGRAFAVSLYRGNLLRLCVLAIVVVLPSVLQALLINALVQQHVPRAFFWANAPIDALTVGPVTAVATAFALDFARRAGLLEEPKPPAG